VYAVLSVTPLALLLVKSGGSLCERASAVEVVEYEGERLCARVI